MRPIFIAQTHVSGPRANAHVARALELHVGVDTAAALSNEELSARLDQLEAERAAYQAEIEADYQSLLVPALQQRERERAALRAVREAFEAHDGPTLADGYQALLAPLAETLAETARRADRPVCVERAERTNSFEIAIDALKVERASRSSVKAAKLADLKSQLAELGVSL